MKKFFNIYLKTFFITSLFMIILCGIIRQRTGYQIPYNLVTISTLLIVLFIALAVTVFKSDKGKGWVNAILGYIIILPALLVVRYVYGQYLFKFTYTIYIIMAGIGLIYGIALLVASKKYKSEVDELNRLLLDKQDNDDDEEE